MTPKTSQTHPLKIDSLPVPGTRGFLGLTFCPGKVQSDAMSGSWNRDLDTDLAAIQAWGATHLVTLNESHELKQLQVADLPYKVPEGVQWHHLPLPDGSAPTKGWEETWNHHAVMLHAALRNGERVVIHCKGGLGRTGTLAAKILIEFGTEPNTAIELVRQARKGAIENDLQEAYLRSLRPPRDQASTARRPYHRVSPDKASRYRGCILGGAVGDALGAPIEFQKWHEIAKQFGEGGLRDFLSAYGKLGAITDDTQMTLFTAEGLLRAHVSRHFGNEGSVTWIVGHALQRWLLTQGHRSQVAATVVDGLLAGYTELNSARAPGNTCLSALGAMKDFHTPEVANNDSKGCGGVMRSAPVGLMTASLGLTSDWAFRLGCSTAALSHGHATGYLTAGVLAVVIHELISGVGLDSAIDHAVELLQREPRHEETLLAVRSAREEASHGKPSRERLVRLGEGWVAEEALAIALYCALVAPNLEEGVILAVNHSGDSDSTGAIAGNLLGAMYGAHEIPDRWLTPLELRELMTEMADDLATAGDWILESAQVNGFEANSELEYWQGRYPGR